MNSSMHGMCTSETEVTHVSSHGVWLLIEGKELFLSFDDSPWFKEAPIGKIMNVEQAVPEFQKSSPFRFWRDCVEPAMLASCLGQRPISVIQLPPCIHSDTIDHRVYFCRTADSTYVLLFGGTKRGQCRDISKAQAIARCLLEN